MNKELLEKYFSYLDLKIIYINKNPNANGVDMWVINSNSRPLSVEIKKAVIKKHGQIQVPPVSNNRKNDDIIAIIVNDKYVLIEPMKDHLKCCSNLGTRQLTIFSKNAVK